ncbi:MAG: GAF domain-containing protein [Anaerolineales bacterium]
MLTSNQSFLNNNRDKLLAILNKANLIASNIVLDELLDQLLDLIIEVSDAGAGTVYLLDHETNELIFKVVKGDEESRKLIGKRISIDEGVAGATVREGRPIILDDITKDPRWLENPVELQGRGLRYALSIPLLLDSRAVGVVQIFNCAHYELELIQLLSNRMASEINKAFLIETGQKRRERLQALIEIIRHIGSTLDQDQILRLIVSHVPKLLDAEASTLFLLDDDSGNLHVHFSTQIQENVARQVQVPSGTGIIGHVVETGETVIVTDTESDPRHYKAIDEISEFETRSILAVPLRTHTINLGGERNAVQEKIIGGLEALNKKNGAFTRGDIELLETLARQAATVLRIAKIYAETNELFFNVIKALTEAIDAKDPYTRGHSQRVADFSVAIARRLELSPDFIHHIRIGGILHDVGKIGIADSLLNKPGRLTQDEYKKIKEHPAIGQNIMAHIRMLSSELPALSEHHERLDGSGYPCGLSTNEISLMGRIVAVADVFDAMTSDRPYRPAIPVPEVFQHLCEGMGIKFAPDCVNALIAAYEKGEIQTQKERS